jgi:hypothetical protein
MRHIDATTVQMSDNPGFRTYDPTSSLNVPKGTKRVDATTVVEDK